MELIIVALLYYTLTCLMCHGLHLIIMKKISPHNQLLANVLRNLVAAFQVSACSLENASFLRRFGMPAFLTVLFCIGHWQLASMPAGFSGNPCEQWRQLVEGKTGIGTAAMFMTGQMIGGQAAFWFARLYWSLGLTDVHSQRLAISSSCVSDLTVPGPIGFGVEFVGVLADSLLLIALGALSGRASWIRRANVQRAISGLVGIWATYHGLYLTGMYSNPANASAQTLGCRGTPLWLHFVVYWTAPLLAVSLGHRLEARLSRWSKLSWPEHDKRQ